MVEYLHLGYVPAPRSIWRGIRKLLPAEVATYRDRSWTTSRFWTPAPVRDDGPVALPVERLRDLLLGRGAVSTGR